MGKFRFYYHGAAALFLVLAFSTTSEAFLAGSQEQRSSVSMKALWRNWIPETMEYVDCSAGTTSSKDHLQLEVEDGSKIELISQPTSLARSTKSILAAVFATTLCFAASSASAVSGGGLDFAGLDISNQDFSNQNYKGKDFTQVLARNTNFAGSNLQGCRFPKAYLINANYEGADLRGVSFEGTNMENTNLKNANLAGAYFGATIIDASNIENADFTDAQFPPKTLALMCDRADMKGTNPTTGNDTRDSAMCP